MSFVMQNLVNRLQLRDFRLIKAIADTGQLALAAESLAITQPAASRTLAAMERLLGAQLFTRHPKGMSLTPLGQTLARNASVLLRGLDQTLAETAAAMSGRSGTVRVGSVTGGAVGFIVPAICQLKEDADGADVHVEVAPSHVLMSGLLRGSYDFVLGRLPPEEDARQFTVKRGRAENVRFLVRKNHPLAGRTGLKLKDLEPWEWVIQANTPMHQAIAEACFSSGAELPSEIVNTTSLLVVIGYLSSTTAIAPVAQEVAELVAHEGADNGRFETLDLDEQIAVEPYHLISLKSHTLSPLATRFHNLVLDRLSAGGSG